jgi:chromosome segregation ATPase
MYGSYSRPANYYSEVEQEQIEVAKSIEAQISELRKKSNGIRADVEAARLQRVKAETEKSQREKAEAVKRDRETRMRTSIEMLKRHIEGMAASYHLENGRWNETQIEFDFEAPYVDLKMRFRPKV